MSNFFKCLGKIFLIKPDYLTPEEKEFYKDLNFKNFIFFKKHFEEFDFMEYLEKLKTLGDLKFLAVDQEGGRVCRIQGDFDPPLKIALDFIKEKNEKKVVNWAKKIAESLKKFWLNLNLAPCVDLAGEEANEFLKNRTFGDDPEIVKKLALTFILEHKKLGIHTCIKHFPGLTKDTLDPHLQLPVKEHFDEKALDVFSSLASVVDFLMTTHIIIKEMDTLPVTFSSKVVNFIRKNMDYRGFIITDDINMGALKDWELQERILLALASGHNFLTYCGDWQELCLAVFDIKSEIEKSKILKEKISESLHIIEKMKV